MSGTNRTPILGNVIAHDCITFRMQGRDIPLQMLQSARDEAESYRERMIALTAQRDAMAEALRFCVKAIEVEAPIYRAHIDEARAALALVEGDSTMSGNKYRRAQRLYT